MSVSGGDRLTPADATPGRARSRVERPPVVVGARRRGRVLRERETNLDDKTLVDVEPAVGRDDVPHAAHEQRGADAQRCGRRDLQGDQGERHPVAPPAARRRLASLAQGIHEIAPPQGPRGDAPRGETGEERQRQTSADDRRAERHARYLVRSSRDAPTDRRNRSFGEYEPENGARQRPQHRPDQHDADKLRRSRSERLSQAQFGLSPDRVGEDQSGRVGARDQEGERGGRGEQEQQRADARRAPLVERHGAHAAPGVGDLVLIANVCGQTGQVGVGRRDRLRGPEPADRVQGRAVAVRALVFQDPLVHAAAARDERRDDAAIDAAFVEQALALLQEAEHAGRDHADHGERLLVEVDGPADHARVRPERRAPQPVGDERHGRRAGREVRGTEQASACRRRAERLQKTRSQEDAADGPRPFAARQDCDVNVAEAAHGGEAPLAGAHIVEVGRRKLWVAQSLGDAAAEEIRARVLDHHEPRSVAVGRGWKEGVGEQRDDRQVGADAEPDGQGNAGRQTWRPAKLPEAEEDLTPQAADHSPSRFEGLDTGGGTVGKIPAASGSRLRASGPITRTTQRDPCDTACSL